MGAGNRARLAAYISLLIAVGVSTLNWRVGFLPQLIELISLSTSMVLLIFHTSWGYLFNNDAEVVKLVARVLPLVAVLQILDGLSVMTGGLLRVAGLQVRFSAALYQVTTAHVLPKSIGALLNLAGYYVIGKLRVPQLSILLISRRSYPLS